MPATDPQNKPNYRNAELERIQPHVDLVRHVSGGTAEMRKLGTKYLPKEKRESDDNYKARLARTVLFEGYLKTRESLVGIVTRKPITLGEDVPPELQTYAEDIDLCGNHLDVFVKRNFRDQFEGCSFILVEMEKPITPPPGQVVTLADEQRANRRPYWTSWKVDQVVNWRTERIDGKQEFTQITFHNPACVPDGDYGEKIVDRYRVFKKANSKVSWTLFEKQTDETSKEEKFVEIDSGELSVSRIPVAVAGELGNSPALLGIAHLNVSHWQNSSDQENILHVTRVPILVIKGRQPSTAEVQVGVESTLDIPMDGDAKWLEIQDNGATKAGRDQILDIERRIAIMGLAKLSADPSSPGQDKTATQVRTETLSELSELATMARSEEDAIELAFDFMAEYAGLGIGKGGSVTLGVAEDSLTLSPQDFTWMLAAVNANPPRLSSETFLSAVLWRLEQAGALPEGIDVEEEKKRLAETTAMVQSSVLPGLAAKGALNAPPGVKNLLNAGGIQ
jgi:hypothetical protein